MSDVLSSPPNQQGNSSGPPSGTQARRNRGWMLLMAMTPVVFAILYALGAFAGGTEPEPVVHPLHTPAGYQAVTDAYFGFAMPKKWSENSAMTDSNGDFYYNGPGGWVGESERIQKTSPAPSTPVPEALWAYGVTTPTKFRVLGGHRIDVPGTSFAWALTLSRPGGSRAQAVDVWEAHSQTEAWLVVHSSPAVERTVLASLQGSAVN